jgi:hypothetical protein
LPKPSRSFCSRMPPTPMVRQLEDCRAPSPFYLCISVWAAWPCKWTNRFVSNACESEMVSFTLLCFFVSPSS